MCYEKNHILFIFKKYFPRLSLRYTKNRYSNSCEDYNLNINNFHKRVKKEIGVESAIEAYPNPSKDNFNIFIKIEKDADAEVIIYDLTGKKVVNNSLQNGINLIEISQIKSGTYYYHVLVNGEIRKTDKLIIL